MAASTPRAAVGIVSIGDMGLGIAKLLQAYDYQVLTTTVGRSPATHKRATDAGISVLPSDIDLVKTADYILSIVPPRDAVATANRIIDAYTSASRDTSKQPLYFLDLNAISPSTARGIETSISSRAPALRFVDGGIIGGPPKLLDSATPPTSEPSSSTTPTDPSVQESLRTWKRPSIPVSGPHPIHAAPLSGTHLSTVLNLKHIRDIIGPASGLKASFAALTKGFYALAIQSYTTAHQLGVLPDLQAHLSSAFPHTRAAAERGVVSMQPKAYRWVGEMEEIGETFAAEGGWDPRRAGIFDKIAEVYRVVADDTALGTEEGKRADVEGVVEALVEGLRKGEGETK